MTSLTFNNHQIWGHLMFTSWVLQFLPHKISISPTGFLSTWSSSLFPTCTPAFHTLFTFLSILKRPTQMSPLSGALPEQNYETPKAHVSGISMCWSHPPTYEISLQIFTATPPWSRLYLVLSLRCAVTSEVLSLPEQFITEATTVIFIRHHLTASAPYYDKLWQFSTAFGLRSKLLCMTHKVLHHLVQGESERWSCSVVSDSLQPHGLQPTRLLHPWDFPGKSTTSYLSQHLQQMAFYSSVTQPPTTLACSSLFSLSALDAAVFSS